jgi:hypothetical protein
MLYQAPDFEDPNPPEEVIPDPKVKAKPPVKGAPVVVDNTPPPPRMITPAIKLMDKENGRLFCVELGRMQRAFVPEVEISSLENSSEVVPEIIPEKWFRYYFD